MSTSLRVLLYRIGSSSCRNIASRIDASYCRRAGIDRAEIGTHKWRRTVTGSGLPEIVERIRANGTAVALFTNGLLVNDENVDELCRLFAKIHVSVDGATAEVHDKIRARAGSFSGAMSALETLNRAVGERRSAGTPCPQFGIDTVIIRSNFHQIEAICRDLTRRFSNMSFLNLGPAVPSGVATGKLYSVQELLSQEQLAQIRDPAFVAKTRALLPAQINEYRLTDNFVLAMDPVRIARGAARENLMHLEADGSVRSMAIYEGTVGNILYDSVDVLWERVLAARQHPVVLDALSSIDTMEEWADAARRIDLHFASDANRKRIHLRTAT